MKLDPSRVVCRVVTPAAWATTNSNSNSNSNSCSERRMVAILPRPLPLLLLLPSPTTTTIATSHARTLLFAAACAAVRLRITTCFPVTPAIPPPRALKEECIQVKMQRICSIATTSTQAYRRICTVQLQPHMQHMGFCLLDS